MRIGLIDGPGHHGPLMISQLRARGHEVSYTRAYPGFVAFDAQQSSIARPADRMVHDAVRRVAASARYRLRRLIARSYDFDLYTRLYGKLATRYFDEVEALIGFSLVCFDAHQRARARGQVAIVELPATHILSHTEIVEEEYRLAGQPPPTDGVVFSRFALERACQEYEQADLIEVLSSFAKETLVRRGVDADKIVVSPLGIDLSLFHPRAPSSESRPFRVLYAGRLELAKGIRYLLEAFARLRLPNAELWMIGASFEEAQPFLKRYPENVKLFSPMPHQELAAHYREADLLVFPTLSDGQGLVMLEGMASGLPVIATDHSGAPDALRDSVDGFVVPIRNAEALAQKILWLYQHRDACMEMGKSARARVEERFSVAHYGERLENGLLNAVRRRQGRGGSGEAPL